MNLKSLYIVPFFFNEYTEIKLCKNCQHFRLNFANETVCSLYGNINVINGKINYEHCNIVRSNSDKCGKHGKLYHRFIPFEMKI